MLIALLRFISVLMLAFFVVALPLTLLARDIGQLVFDADTIKELVGENLLAPEFVAQMAQGATSTILGGDGEADGAGGEDAPPAGEEKEEGLDMALAVEALSHLSEEDWVEITSLIAPRDLVAETVDDMVDGYVAWLDSDAEFPTIRIDLTEWKHNARLHASTVLGIMLDAMPPCSVEEVLGQFVQDIQEGDSLGEVLVPLCRPSGAAYDELLANADRLVAGITQGTPDQIDTAFLQGESAPDELVELKANLVRARTALRWSWAAVLGFGALAVLMAARSWPQALVWAGRPLLLAGAITLLMGARVQFLASGGVDSLFARMFADGPQGIANMGAAVIAGAFPLVAEPLLIQGGVLMASGLAALVGARRMAVVADDAPKLSKGY